jgi:hypothetical protein
MYRGFGEEELWKGSYPYLIELDIIKVNTKKAWTKSPVLEYNAMPEE